MSSLKQVVKLTEERFSVLETGGTVGNSGYSEDSLYLTEFDYQSDWNETDVKKVSFIKNKSDGLVDSSQSVTSISHIWCGSQSDYDAIQTKQTDTIYFIL